MSASNTQVTRWLMIAVCRASRGLLVAEGHGLPRRLQARWSPLLDRWQRPAGDHVEAGAGLDHLDASRRRIDGDAGTRQQGDRQKFGDASPHTSVPRMPSVAAGVVTTIRSGPSLAMAPEAARNTRSMTFISA